MEFERISEHIFRMQVDYQVLGMFSFPVALWLIREDNGWTLIDSGTPDSSEAVVAAIERATRGQGPSRVLVTHAHKDHSGGLNALYIHWQPPILCHSAEAGFITGERDYRDIKTSNLLFWVGREMIPHHHVGLPIAHELQRGEAVGGLVAIHLPGHTPGHLAFLHSTDQAVICGDAIVIRDGRVNPPIRMLTADTRLAHASIRRVGELNFQNLLPSHGEPIIGSGRQAVLAFLGQKTEPEASDDWYAA